MKIIVCLLFIASIEAALRDHAKKIYIGAALSPDHLSDAGYKQLASTEFNCMTPENQMKFDTIEGQKGKLNFGPADQLVQFAQQHGMKIRGHTLVWHNQLPGWVQSISSKTELETVMKNHITGTMNHFKGKIYAWDVVNEALDEGGQLRSSVWSKVLPGFIPEAFKTAHATDPTAKLYYNDYNIESMNAKSNGLYNMVKQWKAEGVPINGIGFQSHFTSGAVPGDFQKNLERFAALGLDVAITELDIRIRNGVSAATLDQQAKDYAHVISACEAVSRCVGVTIWGINDKYSWISGGSALPWDSNNKPKPAVNAMSNVLK